MENSCIGFHSECDFTLKGTNKLKKWLMAVCAAEGKRLSCLNYIFCNDDYLHKLNLKFLDQDAYTDIITFDNSVDDQLAGDLYVSVERVKENAIALNVKFGEELSRVIVHGLLHLCGYTDKTEKDINQMRKKEDKYLASLSIKH